MLLMDADGDEDMPLIDGDGDPDIPLMQADGVGFMFMFMEAPPRPMLWWIATHQFHTSTPAREPQCVLDNGTSRTGMEHIMGNAASGKAAGSPHAHHR